MSLLTEEKYKKETDRLQEYLNKWIGFYYNQTYYCAWFWSNISMPINLSLTLFTALIAAQASSTGSFLSEHDYMVLSFTTMILTTLNSYFRPSIKSMDTNTRLVQWIKFGHKLEELTFDDTPEGKEKFTKFKALLLQMNDFVCIQAGKDRNFLTDWWHSMMRWYRGEDTENWLTMGSTLTDFKQTNNNNDKNKKEIVIEMVELKQ
jgi:hypothetical protein